VLLIPKAFCVNGLKIVSPPEQKYFTFLHLTGCSLTEDELTDWFTKHAVPL
jgi:death-on-curing protein